jgi:N-acetylglutamate synthase-like GNAT family acetyltransferase
MQLQIREARKEDIPQLLSLYNEFTNTFVGSALRGEQDFRRELRRKDNVNLVALDKQKRIAGYVGAHFEKRFNRGEFAEVIVNPTYDFKQVAKPLVEKVHSIFVKKKVISIIAGSIRNPVYEKLFPELGFFETESNGVFMYVILDVQKFLNELQPAFANRLKRLKELNLLMQIDCEGNSIFLHKIGEKVDPLVFTNQSVDFKLTLNREILTKLVFGIKDAVESSKTGQTRIETTLTSKKTTQLLKALFPRKQFLIMDHW